MTRYLDDTNEESDKFYIIKYILLVKLDRGTSLQLIAIFIVLHHMVPVLLDVGDIYFFIFIYLYSRLMKLSFCELTRFTFTSNCGTLLFSLAIREENANK